MTFYSYMLFCFIPLLLSSLSLSCCSPPPNNPSLLLPHRYGRTLSYLLLPQSSSPTQSPYRKPVLPKKNRIANLMYFKERKHVPRIPIPEKWLPIIKNKPGCCWLFFTLMALMGCAPPSTQVNCTQRLIFSYKFLSLAWLFF